MKNFYLILTMMLICILSVTASAEEGVYTPGINSYENSMLDGAKTVIIYRVTENSNITKESIYYVDQCEEAEGFSNLKMGLKLDAPAGVYTVVTNNGKTTFEISDAEASVSGAKKVEFLGAEKKGDSSYSAAFGINVSDLMAEGLTLNMVIGDKAYKTDLFGENSIVDWESGYAYTEDGRFMFALQIDDIGTEYITDEGGKLTPEFDLYVK